jgi:hypothetical protein
VGIVDAVTSRHGVSARAVLLGTLLLPVNAFWLVEMEMGRTGGPYPTTFSLFGNVVLALVVLVTINGLLKRFAPRRAWSSVELLTVYVMLCIGSAICSVDFLDVLVPMIGHPVRFATSANGWAERLIPSLAPGFIVRDAGALRGWYEGNSSLYRARHLRAWAPPVVLWSAFIFVLLGTMACLAAIMRRRWSDHERLAYPVLAVPLALCEEQGLLWRQPGLWQGILVAGGITLLNGLHTLLPALPSLNVRAQDIGPLFTTRPWNALGWTPVSLYPFAIGLGFMLPIDLLFSCWFFYLFFKLQRVAGGMLGLYGAVPRFPYVEEQCVGAYLAVALSALWTGRHYLRRVLAAVWRPLPDEPEREPVSYRLAWAGLIGGTLALAWSFFRAGLGWWWALGAVTLYLFIALACARMRAELGPPAHDLHFAGPERLLTTFFGPRTFKLRELGALTYFFWFNRAYRSIPIAHQIESYKLAQTQHRPPRTMVLPLLLATVVGTLSGFWAHLDLGYRWGVSSKMAGHLAYFGTEAFSRLDAWLSNPMPPDPSASLALLFGLCEATLLQLVRLQWARWPFHPLGLAIAGTWSMGMIWLPMLIAWCAKALLLRYGGIRAYRRALPFFIGLVLGDYLVGCAWPIYGWIAGVPIYSFQQ